MRWLRSSPAVLVLVVLTLAGCSTAPESAPDPTESGFSEAPEAPAQSAPAGDACMLLDSDYLDATLSGVESTFGGALDFGEPLQTPPSEFCSWRDASGGISIELLLEDVATAETVDHSGRTYNIDVEPVVEPQDGPGELAVLLIDSAFTDLGSDELPYGYFFVEGDLAVYLKVVGVDVGRELLRVLAEEVDERILVS